MKEMLKYIIGPPGRMSGQGDSLPKPEHRSHPMTINANFLSSLQLAVPLMKLAFGEALCF